jgi:hypothetical protein
MAAMREVVVVMGNNYPNMFQDQGNTKGDFKVISNPSFLILIFFKRRDVGLWPRRGSRYQETARTHG